MIDRRHLARLATLAAVTAALATATALPARADTLDAIKARGKMVVAIDPTFAPYEETDASGTVTGYDPAVLALIAKDLGVEVEFQKMAFDGIIPGLIAGSFDFSCTALNVTAERAKRIAYTMPVSMSQNVVMKRADDATVTGGTAEALSGHTAAVKAATQPEQQLKEMNKALQGAGKPPIAILSVQTVEQTAEAVSSRRADVVVDDIAVLSKVEGEHKGAFALAGEVGKPVYIAWGTRKTDPALTKALSDGIAKLQADGRLMALQQKFLGVGFKLPTDDFIPH